MELIPMKTRMKMDVFMNDPEFVAGLLNGPCKPVPYCNTGLYPLKVFVSPGGNIRLERLSISVEAKFIDLKISDRLTKVYHSLLPAAPPFYSRVVAVRTEGGGTVWPSRHIVITIAAAPVNVLLMRNFISRLVFWEYGHPESCREKCWVESVGMYLGKETTPDGFYDLRRLDHPACRELVDLYDQDMDERRIAGPDLAVSNM